MKLILSGAQKLVFWVSAHEQAFERVSFPDAARAKLYWFLLVLFGCNSVVNVHASYQRAAK
jgi:hypothetical protein